jgi:predicted neutral ceramidase superfamily lipid hydrolase
MSLRWKNSKDLRCLGVGSKEFFFLFLGHKVHNRIVFKSLENNFEEEHKVT